MRHTADEKEVLGVPVFENDYGETLADIDDDARYCPNCGALMQKFIDWYDIGDHSESYPYWECPECGYCG